MTLRSLVAIRVVQLSLSSTEAYDYTKVRYRDLSKNCSERSALILWKCLKVPSAFRLPFVESLINKPLWLFSVKNHESLPPTKIRIVAIQRNQLFSNAKFPGITARRFA